MHVRKFSIIAGVITSIVLSAVAFAQTQTQYEIDEDPLTARILGSFGGSGAYEIHPYNWFVNTLEDIIDEPIKKPSNIYNFMYQQVKEKPRRTALRRTFERRRLTEEETKKLLKGKDLPQILGQIPIIGGRPTYEDPITGRQVPFPVTGTVHDVLTYIFGSDKKELSEKYLKGNIFDIDPGAIARAFELVTRDFILENELASLEAELESEIVVTEIFADGDESNSGFDLLADLEVIKLLLFGEPVTLAGISGPGNPPGANEIAIGTFAQLSPEEIQAGAGAGGEAAAGAGGAPGAVSGAGGAQPPPGDGGGGGVGGDAAGGAGGPFAPGGIPPLSRPFTPIECYADLNFDQRIQNFNFAHGIVSLDSQGGAGAGGETAGGGIGAAAGASGTGGGGGVGTQPGAGGAAAGAGAADAVGSAPTDEEAAAEALKEITTPKPAANWQRDIFCPAEDVWCFRIQTKFKTESSRLPTENCIACHIEKINDAYMKTVKSNLVPSKATGNLLEIPACKAGWGFPDFLNFNIVFIPQPILTPPNDDIIVKDIFLGNVEKFVRKYYAPDMKAWGFNVEGKMARDAAEAAADRTTAQKSGVAVTQAASEINQEVVFRRQEALRQFKKQGDISKAEGKLRLYQSLEAEVNHMNEYFKTYQFLFGEVNKADGPCNILLDRTPICE